MLILLNKPYRVLCQFTDRDGRATLADFVDAADVYPAGRLDYDSEDLAVLTNDGSLQARISQPRKNVKKIYWAQVEGEPNAEQVAMLETGVDLKDGPARALCVRRFDPGKRLWPRNPPVRYRANIPDSWLEITLSEGRNRQVRRMTAAVGLPTLRLIRYAVGPWTVGELGPGESRQVSNDDAWAAMRP